jgi:hypothetical protein
MVRYGVVTGTDDRGAWRLAIAPARAPGYLYREPMDSSDMRTWHLFSSQWDWDRSNRRLAYTFDLMVSQNASAGATPIDTRV